MEIKVGQSIQELEKCGFRCEVLSFHDVGGEGFDEDATPAMRAAYKGDMDTLRHLAEDGANIAATDKYGWNALKYYCFHLGETGFLRSRNPDAPEIEEIEKNIRWFVSAGTNLDESDIYGTTPAEYLAYNSRSGVFLELFFKLGARKFKPESILHAVQSGGENSRAIAFLAGLGIDPDSTEDGYERVPLQDALRISKDVASDKKRTAAERESEGREYSRNIIALVEAGAKIRPGMLADALSNGDGPAAEALVRCGALPAELPENALGVDLVKNILRDMDEKFAILAAECSTPEGLPDFRMFADRILGTPVAEGRKFHMKTFFRIFSVEKPLSKAWLPGEERFDPNHPCFVLSEEMLRSYSDFDGKTEEEARKAFLEGARAEAVREDSCCAAESESEVPVI